MPRPSGLRVIAFALVASLACESAHAQSGARCAAQALGLSFGQYNGMTRAPTDSIGTIIVSCSGAASRSVAYSVRLSGGTSANVTNRLMRSAEGQYLAYNLYLDPARARIWTDGVGAAEVLLDSQTLVGGPLTRSYPVYGRIFAGQQVPPGVYGDSLIVSVDF